MYYVAMLRTYCTNTTMYCTSSLLQVNSLSCDCDSVSLTDCEAVN